MATTSSSPLLDLPPELRLRIYELLYTPTTATVAIRNDGQVAVSWPPQVKPVRNNSLGLLLSCRTLYNEIEPILTKTVDWKIEMYTWNFRRYGEAHSVAVGQLGSETCMNVLRRVQKVVVEAYAIMQAGDLVKNATELVEAFQSQERRHPKLEVLHVGLNFMYLDATTQTAVVKAFKPCRPQRVIWGRNHARPQPVAATQCTSVEA